MSRTRMRGPDGGGQQRNLHSCLAAPRLAVLGLFAVLMHSSISAEIRAQSAVENSLAWAVRHREGAVYEVVITRLAPKVLYALRMYEVELVEAHKPFIDDGGCRYFPLRMYEWLKARKVPLKTGTRYLVVTELDHAFRAVHVVVKDAIELTDKTAELRAQFLETVKTQSVTGSFKLLEDWDRESPMIDGMRSKNPSGLVDIGLFGFEEDALESALNTGCVVVLARQQRVRTNRVHEHYVRAYELTLIEILAGQFKSEDGALELTGPVDSALPKRGHRGHAQVDGRTYLLIIKPPAEDLPGQVQAHLPVLRPNGPNVMAVKKVLTKMRKRE